MQTELISIRKRASQWRIIIKSDGRIGYCRCNNSKKKSEKRRSLYIKVATFLWEWRSKVLRQDQISEEQKRVWSLEHRKHTHTQWRWGEWRGEFSVSFFHSLSRSKTGNREITIFLVESVVFLQRQSPGSSSWKSKAWGKKS